MSEYWIYGVGLLAQLLFSARSLVQWIQSERAGRVRSPTLFWQLSLVASFLLTIYGFLRDDLVIILGQALSYFIYIRNLQYRGAWWRIPIYFKALVLLFPAMAVVWLVIGDHHHWGAVVRNSAISDFMLTWGSAGQLIFTSRFVYQWYCSKQVGRSVLPPGFWWISLVGAILLFAYGLYRRDPVLLLGQAFGLVIYGRNLALGLKSRPALSTKSHGQAV